MNYSDLICAPYKRGARGEGGFYDCYGLLIELYRRMGVAIADYKTPRRPSEMSLAISTYKESWVKVPPSPSFGSVKSCDPEDGGEYGLVPYSAMVLRVAGEDCHTAMLLPNLQFIHTWQGSGMVVVDRLSSPAWKNKVVGVYQPCIKSSQALT